MVTRLWAWARVLGGAGILALLLWRLGSGAFLDGVRVIDGGTLLVAAGIGLLTTVFSAWRWCLVARGLGIPLPLRVAVADYYRALFLNAALPGGVLGDVHRAVRHGRDVDDVGRGVRAVVLERAAGQVVLVVVGVAVLLASPVPVRLPHVSPVVAFGLLVGVLVAAGLVIGLVVRRRARPRLGRSSPAPGGTSRWSRAWRTGLTDVRLGLLARRNWPGIALASVVVLMGHLGTFVVAARAVGVSAPISQLAPLALLALLAMTLPVNVGGWGPREGVTAWAFGAVGLTASAGLTIAVVYGLLALVASLPGAGVLAVRWLGRRRAARRPVHPEVRSGGPAVRRPARPVPRTARRLTRPVPQIARRLTRPVPRTARRLVHSDTAPAAGPPIPAAPGDVAERESSRRYGGLGVERDSARRPGVERSARRRDGFGVEREAPRRLRRRRADPERQPLRRVVPGPRPARRARAGQLSPNRSDSA